jgi:hypothetical protein
MEWDSAPREKWHHVATVAELADAVHRAAMAEYPESGYAKAHGSYG